MQFVRPAFASYPRLFGKAPARTLAAPSAQSSAIGDDVKLFAATFLAGFLFVSILIG
jgi:hypothetical protein